MEKLRHFAKSLIESTLPQQENRAPSARILAQIERNQGTLKAADKATCDEYASYVLGSKLFAPWLYVYTLVSGKFKEGWIPDNYYGRMVVPKINGAYGRLSSLNALNRILFQSNLFPDVLYYANGLFMDLDYKVVPSDQVVDRLFPRGEGAGRVVYKLDSSSQGTGVYFFEKDELRLDQIQRLGNGTFQTEIIQHREFDHFSTHSVATIRVTTVCGDDGIVTPRACYLRLGSSTEENIRSATHIRVPIDLNTGVFGDSGRDASWLEIEKHPGSGQRFSGNAIPSYRDCLKAACTLHGATPYARCIGWDVAVDHEGAIKVMEWNAGHNDIKFSEATQGPCFVGLGWEQLWR